VQLAHYGWLRDIPDQRDLLYAPPPQPPSGRFIVRNSWGVGWGSAGYFTMPFHYLTDPMLAADFWTIRKVPV